MCLKKACDNLNYSTFHFILLRLVITKAISYIEGFRVVFTDEIYCNIVRNLKNVRHFWPILSILPLSWLNNIHIIYIYIYIYLFIFILIIGSIYVPLVALTF